MKHRATPRFWRGYHGLPEEVRRLADRCHQLLVQNPQHPSLHLKKAGKFWSVRVGLHYRALAVESDGTGEPELVWFWIGTQAEYDRLVGG